MLNKVNETLLAPRQEQAPEESMKEKQRSYDCYQVGSTLRSHGERVFNAIKVIETGVASSLAKSDIDNAIRHSVAMTKALREGKALLFPKEVQTLVPGTEKTIDTEKSLDA